MSSLKWFPKLRRLLALILTVVIFVPALVWWVITNPVGSVKFDPAPGVASPEQLQKIVTTLASMPRESVDINGQARVADYLQKLWESSGVKVERQAFAATIGRVENLVASVGPRTDSRIVVGAHYDTCDRLPGADDNASGIAGVSALVQLLKKNEKQLRHRVDLVAYTLEEPPFFTTDDMGSVNHARSLSKEKAKVELMVSLEMIGYFSDEKDSQAFPNPALGLLYPHEGNFIAVVGKLGDRSLVRRVKRGLARGSRVPVFSINAPPTLEGIDLSDHRSYWAEHFPAVMITDTAFFRNKAYHTAQDTPDRLNYVKMAEVVNGVYTMIMNWE